MSDCRESNLGMEDISGGGERERDRSFTWETPACYEDQSGQTDLILAAKLGKSLLEQNEELSAEYYKIVRKLEVGLLSHSDIVLIRIMTIIVFQSPGP